MYQMFTSVGFPYSLGFPHWWAILPNPHSEVISLYFTTSSVYSFLFLSLCLSFLLPFLSLPLYSIFLIISPVTYAMLHDFKIFPHKLPILIFLIFWKRYDCHLGWDLVFSCHFLAALPFLTPLFEFAFQTRNLTVDGSFGPWSSWTQCTHTDGTAVGSCLCRSRSCDSPAPQCGGWQCEGPRMEITNCSRLVSQIAVMWSHEVTSYCCEIWAVTLNTSHPFSRWRWQKGRDIHHLSIQSFGRNF